ncbi:14621_t:CDS:2, partial [Racocetra persica]
QELKVDAIATGDSLSQVASQTLESLAVIQQVRTYNLSLQQYEDCCSLFEPKNPITKPKKEVVEKLEKEIFWSEILE